MVLLRFSCSQTGFLEAQTPCFQALGPPAWGRASRPGDPSPESSILASGSARRLIRSNASDRETIGDGRAPSEFLGAIMTCVHGRRRSSLIVPAVVGQRRMCRSTLCKSRSLRTCRRFLPGVQVPAARITTALQNDGRQSIRSSSGACSKPSSIHRRQRPPPNQALLPPSPGFRCLPI